MADLNFAELALCIVAVILPFRPGIPVDKLAIRPIK